MEVQKWHQEWYFSNFQGSYNKQNTSVLCFIFVTSLCLPPRKRTFHSPLVCFALLSVRIVACDLLGLWPVFPDCALTQAISCIIWQHRDETTNSKLISSMTLASSALQALYLGNSSASLTWYRENLVFIAYKCAKRWLIELLSSLLQMTPAFWSCSLKSTINHLKVSFLQQAQSNVDRLRNWGEMCENNPSDRCAYGHRIKEEGKFAFSGFIFRAIKYLKKINVATQNVQMLIVALTHMELPLKYPCELKQGPPGRWPSLL